MPVPSSSLEITSFIHFLLIPQVGDKVKEMTGLYVCLFVTEEALSPWRKGTIQTAFSVPLLYLHQSVRLIYSQN